MDNSLDAQHIKDKIVEKNTAVYMNVKTVLVLILMVFNITSCQIFKMPRSQLGQVDLLGVLQYCD